MYVCVYIDVYMSQRVYLRCCNLTGNYANSFVACVVAPRNKLINYQLLIINKSACVHMLFPKEYFALRLQIYLWFLEFLKVE